MSSQLSNTKFSKSVFLLLSPHNLFPSFVPSVFSALILPVIQAQTLPSLPFNTLQFSLYVPHLSNSPRAIYFLNISYSTFAYTFLDLAFQPLNWNTVMACGYNI